VRKQGSAVAAAIALLVASCSSASPTSTTVAALPTTTPTTTLAPSPTTTAVLTTTTASPSTTTASPTTMLSLEAVGSAELKEALIDGVVAEVGAANLGGRENVPFLDINNPDPLVAFASITAFDLWVFTTWPDPPMVKIYTVADSPGRSSYTAAANTFFKGGSRIVFLGSPYSAEGARVVEPADYLAPEVVEQLPSDAVAIAYESSSGAFEVRRVEDESVDISSNGWSGLEAIEVMVPTQFGWQIWYEEGDE